MKPSDAPIKISELYRHFARLRSFRAVKAADAVFIRPQTKYGADTVVVRLADGRWSCNNDRVGRFDHFSFDINAVGKLDILRAIAELGLVTKADVATHKAAIEKYDQQNSRDYDQRQLKRMAQKLGWKVVKRKQGR